MEFKLYQDLYTNDLSARRIRYYRRRIEQGKPAMTLQLVTLPLCEEGLFEVYPYTVFLQNVYREDTRPVYVLGFADSRDGALEVVRTLVSDVYEVTGGFDIKQFIGLRQG